jgi:hypothetical protein
MILNRKSCSFIVNEYQIVWIYHSKFQQRSHNKPRVETTLKLLGTKLIVGSSSNESSTRGNRTPSDITMFPQYDAEMNIIGSVISCTQDDEPVFFPSKARSYQFENEQVQCGYTKLYNKKNKNLEFVEF